jgi:hypothetical protein
LVEDFIHYSKLIEIFFGEEIFLGEPINSEAIHEENEVYYTLK